MPALPSPRRAVARPRRGRVVVLGDLLLDVVVAPARPLARATDVPGRVVLRQGGSAASTARWLARAGVPVTFLCAVGRDGAGRALVAALRADGVDVRAVRPTGIPTGRIGVLVEPGGERTFVADRGAADRLAPADVARARLDGAALLHLPAYSVLGEPLGRAGLAAAAAAHAAGALVTLDLASAGPLLARGRAAARDLVARVAPDLLLATADEAAALTGGGPEGLLALAPAVVVKRGARGATVLLRAEGTPVRLDVATRPLPVADTTGAGDAFDAGLVAGWLDARASGLAGAAALRRAAAAGNRLAARHLANPPGELPLG